MPEPGRRWRIELRDSLELSLAEHDPTAVGVPTGPPVTFVLVHGLASNARTWDGVGQALARAGQRALAVDLRGHGHSSKPDEGYDVATVADDVCRLLTRTAVAPVVLVGQSWGGNVVLEAAVRCPERVGAACGLDGGPIRLAEAWPDWQDCARELAPPPIAGMPAADMEAWLRTAHPDWPESGIEGTLANFARRPDGTIAPWLTRERHMRILRGLWEHDPRALYPRLMMPVLLIEADEGGRAAARAQLRTHWFAEATETMPQAELMGLPKADHDVHCQHPEWVAEQLMRLATRMDGGTAAAETDSDGT